MKTPTRSFGPFHSKTPALWLGLVLCLGSGCASPAAHAPQKGQNSLAQDDPYSALIAVAENHVERGRAQAAIDAAQKAKNTDPKRPAAYVVLGQAFAQLGQLDQAIQAYEKARELGSRSPTLFAQLSSAYDVTKNYPAAISVYEDFLGDHPNDASMQNELGLTLMLSGDLERAYPHLERAHQLQADNPQFAQDLGFAKLRQGDAQGAIRALEPLLHKHPDQRETARLLAQAHAKDGSPQKALDLLDELLRKQPNDLETRRLRGRLHAFLGNDEQALSDFDALAKASNGAQEAWGELIAIGQQTKNQNLVQKASARSRKPDSSAPHP